MNKKRNELLVINQVSHRAQPLVKPLQKFLTPTPLSARSATLAGSRCYFEAVKVLLWGAQSATLRRGKCRKIQTVDIQVFAKTRRDNKHYLQIEPKKD